METTVRHQDGDPSWAREATHGITTLHSYHKYSYIAQVCSCACVFQCKLNKKEQDSEGQSVYVCCFTCVCVCVYFMTVNKHTHTQSIVQHAGAKLSSVTSTYCLYSEFIRLTWELIIHS